VTGNFITFEAEALSRRKQLGHRGGSLRFGTWVHREDILGEKRKRRGQLLGGKKRQKLKR